MKNLTDQELLKIISEAYGVTTKDITLVQCSDPYDEGCAWSGDASQLCGIENIEERLGIGEELLIAAPCGECPNCNGLVHDPRTERIHAALIEARRRNLEA